MITLITGTPGAGKTLYTITHVQAKSVSEHRPVYYYGIKDLALSWDCLDDPESWHSCPAGSIVVLDECQRIFRPQGLGQKVPRHIEELETHRHQGIDLYIITQHPMLIDTKVRRLIGEHRHVHRSFGMERATVHCWGDVRENPDKNRKDSVKTQFAYPRANYSLYKSAEIHTHKRRIPGRVFLLSAMPVLIGICVYFFYSWYQSAYAPKSIAVSESSVSSDIGAKKSNNPDRRITRDEFLELHRPRVEGLAYTAPFFDSVTKPVRAPYPAACILKKVSDDCVCYTDQGTRLDVGKDACKTILANGFFRYWQSEGEGMRNSVGVSSGVPSKS